MNFVKMHGCGNDYIYFDCFNQKIENLSELAVRLSDRHKGIGGDGIVLILRSNLADAKMRMFNADGSEGKMCGNAIRCVSKYLYDASIVKKKEITIETLAGIKYCWINTKNGLVDTVKVDMGKPEIEPKSIPVISEEKSIINQPIGIGDYHITCVSIGNPHCIVFVEDVDALDLEKIGPLFEKHLIFPDNVNTEFIQVVDNNVFKMRVWERGSGETYACGTGACAAVVAGILNNKCAKDIDVLVKLRGGDLMIRGNLDKVYMTGPAKKVFEGCVDIEN